MQFIIFALTYPLIWLLSRLPMRVLYVISDGFFFLNFYVIKYRKKVVLDSLNLAFPEKSNEEKKAIAKGFFIHFTDLFIESIKAFSISEKEVLKRYKYKNPEVINNIVKEGKSIALVGAHQANWEWSFSTPLVLDGNIFGAYTKLGNKYFEKKLRTSRERFGVIGYKTSETVKGMQKNFSNKIQGSYILLSDQSPRLTKTHYWHTFFGINVPIHTGAEMLARKFDMVVVNYVAKKVKRGYYETEFQIITEKPKLHKEYEITDKYLALTEKNINKQPELYLWSHKRFKHRNKIEEWKKMKVAKQKTKK
ncbi:lipid A biosynthesis acyltransferase [Polaribacter reichenbachii]|uniref:Lipid A biosynthesis acyltransferase n=1 Tax=Polaribacter reichenbachii TaxID=996801 RepID=A0A1B8TR69_9FLAO|nr:lysophospholipid acyltransferase family protein [Polaribacter reichenbachii]APZ47819.1 lipid A biosynthesis acyltransferase [Polaribacter reichenbachii]AUC18454.1 lipid A biosynthesis acyltransferase [Polaribacter reichenbachii]OBY62196.1 lipid A biosynthesis acyltransferase [Polaribacter reichenbachii]